MYLVGEIAWVAVLCGLLHLAAPGDGSQPPQPRGPAYYAAWLLMLGGAILLQYGAAAQAGRGRAAVLLDLLAMALYAGGHLGLRWLRHALRRHEPVGPLSR